MLFVWPWLVVNNHKFSIRTVFFFHTNQPAVQGREMEYMPTLLCQVNDIYLYMYKSSVMLVEVQSASDGSNFRP